MIFDHGVLRDDAAEEIEGLLEVGPVEGRLVDAGKFLGEEDHYPDRQPARQATTDRHPSSERIARKPPICSN